MTYLYIIIIILLSIAVVILSLVFFNYQRSSSFISDEDKEFLEFAIDMYCDYANELNIHSDSQHEKIVKRLEKIKQKHFKNEKD